MTESVLVWCDVHKRLEQWGLPELPDVPPRCAVRTALPPLSFRPATEADLLRGSSLLDELLGAGDDSPHD